MRPTSVPAGAMDRDPAGDAIAAIERWSIDAAVAVAICWIAITIGWIAVSIAAIAVSLSLIHI